MPGKNTAQTGWVIAATEGGTVDGRTITKQWIEDMAETYSPEEYTAVIWPEHFRSSWGPYDGKNWGTVDDVKAAKKGGKLRLFVKLTANSYLLDANKDGQKLFMSIEPNTDFTGNGKCYLQGLAVTDSPASTGTTRLKFSMGESEIEHDYSMLEVLQHSDFIFTHPNKTQSKNNEAEAKSLLTQLFNLFSTEQAPEASDKAEDEAMTEEQYNALMGKIDGVTGQVSNLEKKFTELDGKVEKFTAEDDSGGDDGNEEGKETNSVTAEQFSQLNETITGLTEKFTGIETKFNEFSKEIEGQEPNPEGKGETVDFV